MLSSVLLSFGSHWLHFLRQHVRTHLPLSFSQRIKTFHLSADESAGSFKPIQALEVHLTVSMHNMNSPEIRTTKEVIPLCNTVMHISLLYLIHVIFVTHTERNCCVSESACEQTQCVFAALSTSKQVLRKHQRCCGYAQPTCTPQQICLAGKAQTWPVASLFVFCFCF